MCLTSFECSHPPAYFRLEGTLQCHHPVDNGTESKVSYILLHARVVHPCIMIHGYAVGWLAYTLQLQGIQLAIPKIIFFIYCHDHVVIAYNVL